MVSIESSESITAWGEQTFGKVSDLNTLIERAKEELEVLQQAIENGESVRNVVADAAEIAILMHRLVGLHGAELSFAIDEKMARNRTRIWSLAGDGTGRRVA